MAHSPPASNDDRLSLGFLLRTIKGKIRVAGFWVSPKAETAQLSRRHGVEHSVGRGRWMREHSGWEGQLVRTQVTRSHASNMVFDPKYFVQFKPSLIFSDMCTRCLERHLVFTVLSILRAVPPVRNYSLHFLNEESEAEGGNVTCSESPSEYETEPVCTVCLGIPSSWALYFISYRALQSLKLPSLLSISSSHSEDN